MSEVCKNWSSWLKKTRFAHLNDEQMQQTLKWLFQIRDIVLDNAEIKKGDKIIDIGCGTGLIGFGALDRHKDEIEIIFSDKFTDCVNECKKLMNNMKIANKVSFLESDCLDIKLPAESMNKAMTRSVLVHIKDKQRAINEIYRILKPGGIYSAFEPIISSNTRYWELVNPDEISDFEQFKKAENEFMTNPEDSLVNFDQNTLAKNLDDAGFSDGEVKVDVAQSNYLVDKNAVQNWFESKPSPTEPNVKERFLKFFEEPKVNKFISELQIALNNKTVTVKSNTVFIRAKK